MLILGVMVMGLGVAAGAWLSSRSKAEPALNCPPERIHFRDGGAGPPIAYCGDATNEAEPAGAALAVGKKLDLNTATEADLAVIPGVGQKLAASIVKAREEKGGFKTWEDVDELPGVGASKIELLRAHTDIHSTGDQP